MNKAPRIRIISERIMSRGYEPAVARLMETLKSKVRQQPGFISVETLCQIDNPNKYVVFSEWESQRAYDRWTNSSDFKECSKQLNQLLDVPDKQTRIFEKPKENIFLL